MLAAEEKKAKNAFSATTDPTLFNDIEHALHQSALTGCPITMPDLPRNWRRLAICGRQLIAFFDGIVVNDDDPAVRLNRLGLLAMIREKMQLMVADFTKIEG